MGLPGRADALLVLRSMAGWGDRRLVWSEARWVGPWCGVEALPGAGRKTLRLGNMRYLLGGAATSAMKKPTKSGLTGLN